MSERGTAGVFVQFTTTGVQASRWSTAYWTGPCNCWRWSLAVATATISRLQMVRSSEDWQWKPTFNLCWDEEILVTGFHPLDWWYVLLLSWWRTELRDVRSWSRFGLNFISLGCDCQRLYAVVVSRASCSPVLLCSCRNWEGGSAFHCTLAFVQLLNTFVVLSIRFLPVSR